MKTPATRTNQRCHDPDCGGELDYRCYKHTEKVGRWKSIDGGSMAWQCKKCGMAQLSLDELQEYQLWAAKTVLSEGKIDGSVVRYARKALGLTQKELGLLLGYQHETVSKWENDKEPLQQIAMMALVGLLCRKMAGEQTEDMMAEARAFQEGNELTPSHAIEVRRRRAV